MSLETKDWSCPKKIKARYETIIKSYRQYSGRESIPADSQYWTMIGKCSDGDGKLSVNVEPDQIIKSAIAKPHQIHGVEIKEEIFDANNTVDCGINWYNGDFLQTMKDQMHDGVFEPAIVNADLVCMKDRGSSYVAKIMKFLSDVPRDIMLVCNIILAIRSHMSIMQDMVKDLKKHRAYDYAMDSANWKQSELHYEYPGTGNSMTRMGSLIFYKNTRYNF